jgi:hypothetical protein
MNIKAACCPAPDIHGRLARDLIVLWPAARDGGWLGNGRSL